MHVRTRKHIAYYYQRNNNRETIAAIEAECSN